MSIEFDEPFLLDFDLDFLDGIHDITADDERGASGTKRPRDDSYSICETDNASAEHSISLRNSHKLERVVHNVLDASYFLNATSPMFAAMNSGDIDRMASIVTNAFSEDCRLHVTQGTFAFGREYIFHMLSSIVETKPDAVSLLKSSYLKDDNTAVYRFAFSGTSISLSKYDGLYQSESQIKETSEQLKQGKRLLIYGKGKIVMRFHPTSKKVVDFRVVCKRTGVKPSIV